jgi:hypothetical protein
MPMSKGCTIALIAAGIVVALVIIGGVYICSNPDKLIGVVLDSLEKEMAADIPEGYTAESIHQIMTDFRAAFKEGKITPTQMQSLSASFQSSFADKKLTPEEGRLILDEIQIAMGQTPAAGGAVEPVPSDTLAPAMDSIK